MKTQWNTPDGQLTIAQYLAQQPQTEWYTIRRLADELHSSNSTLKPAVLALAGAGFLDMQDGWTRKEDLRFRLRPELRNVYTPS